MIVPCLQGASWSVLKGGIPLKSYFLTNLNQVSSLDLKVVRQNSVLSSLETINQNFKENTQISLKRFRLSQGKEKRKNPSPRLLLVHKPKILSHPLLPPPSSNNFIA